MQQGVNSRMGMILERALHPLHHQVALPIRGGVAASIVQDSACTQDGRVCHSSHLLCLVDQIAQAAPLHSCAWQVTAVKGVDWPIAALPQGSANCT